MVSVIIITHNNEQDIIPCLNSLPWQNLILDVHLIDNASKDKTREKVEQFLTAHKSFFCHPVWNHYNSGYAHAVNQGLMRSKNEFILLLGPDTICLNNAILTLFNTLKNHSSLGIAAPQLLNLNYHVSPSCRRFPKKKDLLLELSSLPKLFSGKWTPSWKMPDFTHTCERDVDQPEASCLLIRTKAFLDVGFMDERFPLFFNDVDWCRRFRNSGWGIRFIPEAKVLHRKGTSVNQNKEQKIWKSHQGFYRYFQKYASTHLDKSLNIILGFFLMFTGLLRIFIIRNFNQPLNLDR